MDLVIRMKQLATELVWYKPDGSIVIPPHPRQLPNEIIALILGHVAIDLDTLYTCLFVTKQFSPMAKSLLWRTPNLRNRSTWRLFLGSLLAASAERRVILGRYVQRLNLDAYWWDNEDFTALLPYVPFVTYCMIRRTQLTRTPLQQLARHCQYLTTLFIDIEDLTEACFVAMGQHCPYLCDFEWYAELGQMPIWLKHLSCPLERLRLISYQETIDDEALSVIQGMDQLWCLELYQDLPDPLTHLLGPYWPHLTKLWLGPCATISEHAWIDFFRSHPHLESLDLERIETWTSLPSLPRLTYLSLHGNNIITSNDLRRYIQHNPQLASVRIELCEWMVAEDFSVDDDGVICLDKTAIEGISRIDCS